MAKKKPTIPTIDLEAILKKREKEQDVDPAFEPRKQVEGYKKRLEATGIDPEKATDSRKGLKKLLNLKEDQNVLFDAFEVLGRPQQALFGAIKAGQKGEDVLKGTWEGFSGHERIQGKELLHNIGLDDSEEKFGVDDVLGMAVDIFVDPLRMPVAAMPIGSAKMIEKATEAVTQAQAVYDMASAAGGTVDAIKAAEGVLENAKLALDAAKKVKLTSLRTVLSRSFRSGFSKAANLADNGLVRVFQHIDTKNLEKIEKAHELGIGDTVERIRALEKYTDFKKYIVSIVDATKRLPQRAWDKVFKIRGAETLSKAQLDILANEIDKYIKTYATKVGKTAEEVGRDVMTYIEYVKYKPTGSYLEYLKNPIQALDDQAYETVKPLFAAVGYNIDEIYTKTTVNGKNAYQVINKEMHKAFVKEISENADDATSEIGAILSKNWGKNVTDNAGRNLFKGDKNVKKQTRFDFYRNAKKYITDMSDGTVAKPTNAEINQKVVELLNDAGLGHYATEKASGINTFSNYISQIINKRYLANTVERTDMLLPRFLDEELLTRLTNTYALDGEFKDVVEGCYEIKVKMEETLVRVYNEAVGDGKFKISLDDGIIPHTASGDLRELKQSHQLFPDYQSAPVLRGRTSLLKNRDYKVSAQEANALYLAHVDAFNDLGLLSENAKEFFMNNENAKLFVDTLQESITDMVVKTPKLATSVTMIDEVLATSWLADNDLIRIYNPRDIYNPNHTISVPLGYTKVNRNQLITELERTKSYLGDQATATDTLIKALQKNFGGVQEVVIENNIYNMVEAFTDEKRTKGFMRFMDKVNSLFKKTKLLSPGFQLRNFMGNSFNIYAAGVPLDQITMNYGKAHQIISKGDEVLTKVTKGLELSLEEQKIWKWYKPFVENNFHEISRQIYNPEAYEKVAKASAELEGILGKTKKAADWVVELNSKGNQFNDERFRLALFMFGTENPEMLTKFNVSNPAELVRKVLFDPTDLSWAEKETFRKFVPFYTFTKKNLVYQFENFFRNTQKYINVKKTLEGTWRAMELEPGKDVEQYKLEDFWIPVPFLDKDGNYRAIKAKLPIEDLGELFESPLRKFVAASSPMIRAPYEYAANKQLFTGMPIEEFKGQRGYAIPEIGRKAEYLLGQSGLDIPVSGVMDIGRTAVQGIKGELADKSGLEITEQALGRSIIHKGSAEKTHVNLAYQELDELRDLFRYYKQENIDIVKISELENQTPMQAYLKRLKALNASFSKKN